MKKAAAFLLAVILLTGCSQQNRALEQGLKLRTQLLGSSGCQFDVDITADYGDKTHSFSLQCQADSNGTVEFTVKKPESIAFISGKLDGRDGALTFEETALYFPMLADNQLSPISAPWLLVKTLRGGCLTSAGTEGEYTRLSIDDSYADDALHLDIWLDQQNAPIKAEILFRERKILSLDVKNFTIQ